MVRPSASAPGAVAADRNYHRADTERELSQLGINRVAIPRQGQTPAAHEHTSWFRQLVKWRTGAEGRLSCLKRDFGWDRTRLSGITGARTWCGYGTFAHNLVKLATA